MITQLELPTSLVLYFDGACEPNPGGIATYGWLLCDHAGLVWYRACGCVKAGGPSATNNVAEYSAVGFALRWLADRGWRGVLHIRGDSKLVINQLAGDWECRSPRLLRYLARCHTLLAKVAAKCRLEWVPRDVNERADALSQYAYTKYTGKPFPTRRRR